MHTFYSANRRKRPISCVCVCVCVCVETLAPEKQAATEVTICLAKFIGAKVAFFFENKKTFFKFFFG